MMKAKKITNQIIAGLLTTVFIIASSFADTLTFPLCPQEKSQWCWAASAQGLLKYYGFDVEQEECVKVKLPNLDNRPAPMSWIRDILNNWDCENVYEGSHTFTESEMKKEIDDLHPFCVFWHWNGGGGHFVDIHGYTDDIFHIMNPWSPNVGAWQRGTYDYVKNAQNRGYWRGTVWTTLEVKPYVRVRVPNGGEKWDQYSTRTLNWGCNVSGNVKIELLKGTGVKEVLSASFPSDSFFTWKIAEDFELGTDYKIRVTSLDNNMLIDESDNTFSIVEEYIAAVPYVQSYDDFDTGTTLVEYWEQLSDDMLDWTVWKGPTPSRIDDPPDETGPTADHSGSGNYIFVEASGSNNPDKTAHMISPKINLQSTNKVTVSFWYHMFSAEQQMGDLAMDILVNDTWYTDVITITGNQGDQWSLKELDISDAKYKDKRVRFRFRGKTGDSWQSDICIDDFKVEAPGAIFLDKKSLARLGIMQRKSRIQYCVPATDNQVTIRLFTSKGALLSTPVDEVQRPGTYTVELFDETHSMAHGLYLVTMKIGTNKKTIKILNR